jgi:hypothetical protein
MPVRNVDKPTRGSPESQAAHILGDNVFVSKGSYADSGLSGDFERDFSSVLDPAASYGEIVHRGVAPLHPPDAFVNQVPESTVWRLQLAVTAASRPPSSVFALGTPRSATHRRARSPGRVGTPRLHRRQLPCRLTGP